MQGIRCCRVFIFHILIKSQ